MRWYQQRLTRKMLLLVLLVLLTGCSGLPPGLGGASGPTPSPQMSPTPTIPTVPRKMVTFPTQDHVKLAGDVYGSGGTTAIICSHERQGNKSNWSDLAPWFAAKGFLVLAFDFRGYGDSEGPSDLSKLDKDMHAAIAFVQSRGAKKVILLGASLGAIISLMVASETPVAGVISLSGGYYRDQAPPTLTPKQVKAIAAPKLFIASENDSWVDETLQVYLDAVPPKELHLYPGSAHGTSIGATENGSDLILRIIAFANTYAPF
jgi:pimeloyl-ACP methyl ester carboxylesterase